MDFNLSPEQLALQARAREFGMSWRGKHAEWDAKDLAPYDDVVAALRDANLLGLTIPKQYGGQGGTASITPSWWKK